MNIPETTFYFTEGSNLYVVDSVQGDSRKSETDLGIVDTFGLVRAYEDNLGGRKKNTFYVWWKANQETFKGEVTLHNLVGFEGSHTFVGFGSTEKECIEHMIGQFCSHLDVECLD